MVKQIFEISDDAAKQINVAAEESESSKWPLRISLNVDSVSYTHLKLPTIYSV